MEESLPKPESVHLQIQTKQFLDKWLDLRTASLLRTNAAYQQKFLLEVGSLQIKEISEIANQCVQQLLDSDINRRDTVIEVLKRLPLRDLDQKESDRLLQLFISQIEFLQKSATEQTVISPILESMTEALEEMKELRDSSPTTWNKLLRSMETVALKADPLCKQMVFSWMKEFAPL